MDITFTPLQIIELFFRFATVGQLSLLIVFYLKPQEKFPAPKIALISSIIGYILLTAPIEDHHYGGLRHVLLLITDLTPYVILWFTLTQLDGNFTITRIPKWILMPSVAWLLILIYLFLVLGGAGILHDVNHALGILVLLTVMYLCLSEFIDDLDNRRRNVRLLLVTLCSFYMLTLVSFEFVYQGIRNTWQFSFFNTVIIFMLAASITVRIIFKQNKPVTNAQAGNEQLSTLNTAQINALNELMAQTVYLQPELTIGKLATLVSMPAHQLRQLINQQLGFSNFSHYLNSYRIPWVCEQLRDPTKQKLPILTIALEAGYGSIAPFNRAFKAQMAQTPKEYRSQFQK